MDICHGLYVIRWAYLMDYGNLDVPLCNNKVGIFERLWSFGCSFV